MAVTDTPFSPEFAIVAEDYVTTERDAGVGAADALRHLELLCGKSGVEFHPDGPVLVERLYADRGGLPEQRYVSGLAIHEQVSAEPPAVAAAGAKPVASAENPATVAVNDDAEVAPSDGPDALLDAPDDPDDVIEQLNDETETETATDAVTAKPKKKK